MRVLIVGDSQAAGPMGAKLQQLFEAQGATVTRWGEVGWTADRWIAERWGDVLAAVHGGAPPDLVVYVLGTNDIYRSDRTRPSAITLRDVGPETWFIGAPSYRDPNLTTRVNATLPIFKSVFGNRYIDSRSYTSPTCDGRTPDCIHFVAPSGLGQRWAQSAFSELQRRRGATGSAQTTSLIGWGFAATVLLGGLGLVVAFRERRA